MVMTFDSHKHARRLLDAGMPSPLADIVAETTGDLMGELIVINAKLDGLAEKTQARFEHTEERNQVRFERTDGKIDMVEVKVNARIDQVEARLDAKIADTKAELIRWVVGVGILQTALITALLLKMMH